MKNNLIHLRKNIKQWGLVGVLFLTIASCEDFVNIDVPKTEITKDVVFSTDASAMSAIRGLYSRMMSNQSFTKGELERYTGLSSGEFINYSTNQEQQQFASAALLPINSVIYRSFWGEAYAYINNANSLLEGLEASQAVTQPVKAQLQGEALFVRAFCHFYLVNLFGDIPYITTTDYKTNASKSRLPADDVFTGIIEDLLRAKELLPEEGPVSTNSKTQPRKNTIHAFLSRVYLYTQQWELAEQEASAVINSGKYTLPALNSVFNAASTETIWHLKPVVPGTNTPQGQFFILTGSPAASLGGVSLSNDVYEKFDELDQRKTAWIGSSVAGGNTFYFPHKYKKSYDNLLTEYTVMFRLAELYLVRAEARAHLEKIDEAKEDINRVRDRAGLPETLAADPETLLAAIEQERVLELFSENGHRWLDLIRTGRVNDVLPLLKPNWQPEDARYPIPQAERLLNPNLSQNEGY